MAERLEELEARFFALISRPGDPREIARRLASGGDPGASPLEGWLGGGAEVAARGIGIYASMYFARLHDALAEEAPKTAQLLGPEAFEALAVRYFAESPSRHPCLQRVADALPAHLEASPQSRPDLADLVRLELARSSAFVARDARPLAYAELQALPPSAFVELPIRFGPASRIVRLGFAADELWLALEEERPPPPPEPGPREVIVWRRGFSVYHRAVSGAEARALEVASGGATFAAVCEAFVGEAPEPEEAAARMFACLRQWIVDEVLASP